MCGFIVKIVYRLQNIMDLTVVGYKVFTLDFVFKISGHATKSGRFYFGFIHLRVNAKRIHYQNVTVSSRIRKNPPSVNV